MSKKLLIPCLYLQAGRAVTGFGQRNLFGDGDVEKLARFYSDNGADELLVFDFSSGDEEHEHAIGSRRSVRHLRYRSWQPEISTVQRMSRN